MHLIMECMLYSIMNESKYMQEILFLEKCRILDDRIQIKNCGGLVFAWLVMDNSASITSQICFSRALP